LKAEVEKHHASHNDARRIMNKFFWELQVGDINRSHRYNCNIINGNKGMHQVRSMSTRDPTLIQFRHVSCVCVNCANRNSNTECELAIHHVPNWTLARLEPNDCLQVRDAMYFGETCNKLKMKKLSLAQEEN
jgi:hypothetical protein